MLVTGASSQGQGHETTLAQVCAAELGVPIDRVTVVEGDTGQIPLGIGTWASRTAVMAGNAVSLAARAVGDKALALAAISKVQPELARGVSKGVLHKNTAARKFSRLTRRIAALG